MINKPSLVLLTHITVFISMLVFSYMANAKTLDQRKWQVKSPNGQVEIRVRGNEALGLEYQIIHWQGEQETVAVNWSKLGLTTRYYDVNNLKLEPIDSDFSKDLTYFRGKRIKGKQTYTMVTGKRKENTVAYFQRSLNFKHNITKQILRVDFRALDTGAAFRYVLPNNGLLHHQLRSEITEFNIGTDAQHWGQPYDFVTMYHPSYETEYLSVPAGTSTPAKLGTGWGFPSLFSTSGLWVFLHESGLNKQFHGSHLQPDAPNGVYKIALPLAEEALGNGSIYPAGAGEWKMPWRTFAVSNSIGDIVESNLVFDLAEPAKIEDTKWIKPGASSWSWWSDHNSVTDVKALKSFIRLADKMGWPYSLVDANWPGASETVMQDLIAYGKERGVGMLFWYNSGGPNNFIPEQPRNVLYDRLARRKEFKRISALGVKGVKIDFFQSDKQFVIEQYLSILEDAAEFKLLVIFHGSTIPRGWARTWPNLMTMEAVRGGEFYTFSEDIPYGLYAPKQNTILPFTRNVVGSMDYTPVAYTHRQSKRYTTFAHETALPIIFESGIQHLADTPDAFLKLPEVYKDYFWHLPTAWDETKFLAGTPGEEVILARRKGNKWYVAGINGENESKDWVIDFSVLAGRGTEARLYTDSPEINYFSEKVTIPHGKKMKIPIQPFGGFVMVFKEPKK